MAEAGTAYVIVRGDWSQFEKGGAAATAGVQKRMDSMWATAGQRTARVGQNMSRLGQQMNRTVTLPILALAGASVKAASDFQGALTQVETQAGASRKEIEGMRGAILKLSPAVGKTPVELANALFHIESAGMRGSKALDVLTQSAKLAQIGHSNLESTTNALVAVMSSAPKDVKSATDAIGLMNAIVGQGNMRMDDLTAAMSTGILPTAKSVGLGLRDVGAAIDVMTKQGVPAQDAATRLRMTFSLLSAPTKQAAKELAGVGLGQSDLAKDLRKPDGLVVAVQDLKKHMEDAGLSAIQQNQLIARAFGGGRSSSAILTLIQNVGDLQSHFDGIGKDATPEKVNKKWKTTTHDLGFQFDQLKSDAVTAGAKIGQAIGPSLISFAKDIVSDASSIANAFSKLPKGAQQTIVTGGLILAGIGPALRLAGVFTTGVGRLYDAAQVITRLSTGGGLIGRLRGGGAGGAGGVLGGTRATNAVATMEVGTLIARSMVGGGPGGRAGTLPAVVGGAPSGTRTSTTASSRTGLATDIAVLGQGKHVSLAPAAVRTTGLATDLAALTGMEPAAAGRQWGATFLRSVRASLGAAGRGARAAAPLGAPLALLGGGAAVGGRTGGTLAAIGTGALLGGQFGGPYGALAGGVAGLALDSATHASGVGRTAHGFGLQQGGGGFDKSDVKFLNQQIGQLVSTHNVQGLKALATNYKDFTDSTKQNRQVQTSLRQLQIQISGMQLAFRDLKNGSILNMSQLRTDMRRVWRGIAAEMQTDAATGTKDAFSAFQLGRQNVKRLLSQGVIDHKQAATEMRDLWVTMGQATKGSWQSIAKEMKTDSAKGSADASNNIGAYVSGVRGLLKQHVIDFQQAMSKINSGFLREAKAFGLSGGAAKQLAGVQTLQSQGTHVTGRAKGGFVGQPGEAGPDDTLLHVRPGTPILNRWQQMALGMFAGGGQVPVMVGRGEWKGEPEDVPALNRLAAARGFGSLDGLYSTVTRPHYLAKGGLARGFAKGGLTQMLGEASAIDRHHFPYVWGGGHNDAFSGPYDCSGAVSAVLHAGGLLGHPMVASQFKSFGQPGPGAVTLYASDGHVYMSLDGKFWGTSNSNPGGGAGWFPGGARPGFTVRHVPASGGTIKTPKIGGPDTLLKSITQAGISKVAGGANKKLSNMMASLGQAGGGDMGNLGGPWLSVLADFAHSHGWSIPDWKWLTGHESSNVPSKMNPSGHFGLGQLSRENQAKYHAGPGSSAAQQVVAMGEYIADRYGSPTRAKAFWQGHGYYGRGGIAQALARGGFAGSPPPPPGGDPPLPPGGGDLHAAARDGSIEDRTTHLVHKLFQTLGQFHFRPPHARMPGVAFFSGKGPAGGYRSYVRPGSTGMHLPRDLLWLLFNKKGKPGGHWANWLKQTLIHETAHTMQKAHLLRPTENEGGAQDYADLVSPSVFARIGMQFTPPGDSSYAGYVRWVRDHHTQPNWTMRDQFGGYARGGIARAATGLLTDAGLHRTRKGHKHLSKLDKARRALTVPFSVPDVGDLSKVTAAQDSDLGRLDSQESLLERIAGFTLPDGTNQTVLGQSDIGLLAATFPPSLTVGEQITDAQLQNRNMALADMVKKVSVLQGSFGIVGRAINEREQRKKLVAAFLKQQYKRYKQLAKDLSDLKSSSAARRLAAATDQGRRSQRIDDAKDTIAHYQALIADERAKGKRADKGAIRGWEQKIRDEDAFIRKEREHGSSKATNARIAVMRNDLQNQIKPVQDDLSAFGGSRTAIGHTGDSPFSIGNLNEALKTLYEDKGGLIEAVTQLTTSDIPNMKLDIQALGAKPPVTSTASPTDSQKADLLQTLLDQAHLDLTVSQRQYDVLRAPPFGGSFAEGGVVPGPVGAPRMIIAHGGETVSPPGDGGSIGDVHLHFTPGTEWLRDFVRVEVDGKLRQPGRAVGASLPGAGGGGFR